MRRKISFIVLAILLIWLCGCLPLLEGISEILEGVPEGLSESPGKSSIPYRDVRPESQPVSSWRPWTGAELVAWEDYKAALWEDIQSTIIGIRVTEGRALELNPNLPPYPTEAQVIADYNRVLRVNWNYCNQSPEERIPFLRQRAQSHRRAAAHNYEDMRRKGWIQ